MRLQIKKARGFNKIKKKSVFSFIKAILETTKNIIHNDLLHTTIPFLIRLFLFTENSRFSPPHISHVVKLVHKYTKDRG